MVAGRGPDLTNIGPEHLNAFELLGDQGVGSLLLTTAQFRFGGGEVAQTLLPLGLQPSCNQPIFGLHAAVPAFGPLRFVASALHLQTPLRQRRVVVDLELFDREPHGFNGGWCDGFQKSVSYALLDYQTADVEAVHTTSVDEVFAGAVITRSRVPAAIVNMQIAGHNGRR